MKNVLYVNKPKGITSFDVCFRLRKVLNTKKIGHTGTLDPNATGVMIVLFDKATKANQFLVHDRKKYEATVELGYLTDTLDCEGKIIAERKAKMPEGERIEKCLKSFLGKSSQLPPLTSAIKVEGKKLYEYQRENREVEIPLRDIEIYDISLTAIKENTYSFKCEVSSGTYIRTLVRDINERLGILGTLKELTRVAVDDITLDMCDDLEDVLRGEYEAHDLTEILKKKYPFIEVKNAEDVKNGKPLKLNLEDERVLILHDDEALAVYEKKDGTYRCLRGLF